MGGIIIKKLGAADQDQVSRFRMDDPAHLPLKIFIRREARKSAANHLTQTYIAKRSGDGRVVGFISLMCAEIKLEGTYPIEGGSYPAQPAVRIARFAVEDGCRGQNLGRDLLDIGVNIALSGIRPQAGCRFVILDAKQGSVAFYQRHGFRLLDTDQNRLRETPAMFLDLKLLA